MNKTRKPDYTFDIGEVANTVKLYIYDNNTSLDMRIFAKNGETIDKKLYEFKSFTNTDDDLTYVRTPIALSGISNSPKKSCSLRIIHLPPSSKACKSCF